MTLNNFLPYDGVINAIHQRVLVSFEHEAGLECNSNTLFLLYARQWNEIGGSNAALTANYNCPASCSCPHALQFSRDDRYSYLGPSSSAIWSVFRIRDLPQALDHKTLMHIANFMEFDTKKTEVLGGKDVPALYDDVLSILESTAAGLGGATHA